MEILPSPPIIFPQIKFICQPENLREKRRVGGDETAWKKEFMLIVKFN